jgi:hypothetical protein
MENNIDKPVDEKDLKSKQPEQRAEPPNPLIYEASPGYAPYIIP